MSQKLLSICIPTLNRAQVFKKTLDNIIPQALKLNGKVEICISDNCSIDDTKEVVMDLIEKYPDLIRFNENEENIGFDRNIIKVVGMAEGRFAWTFSDYSFIVDGGLKEILNYLESMEDKNVGLVGVRQEVYTFDENNHKKLVQITQDKTKPYIIKLNAKDTIEKASLRGITHVILNTKLIKKIYKENCSIVKMGVGGLYMHSWLYYIMFVLNKNLKCHIINKVIVSTPYKPDKKIIEDHFVLVCNGNIRFFGMLESICRERGNDDFAKIFSRIKNEAKRGIIWSMLEFKILDQFEYDSYFSCLQHFYKCLKFADASSFSISFAIISIIPRSFLRIIMKMYLKIKYGKKATSKWDEISRLISLNQKGKMRRPYNTNEWRGKDRIQGKF